MLQLLSVAQFEELLASKKAFIVWCSAAWCKPCQGMDKGVLEEASAERGIPIYYCDETVNPNTISLCNIRSFPTFCLFNDGKHVLSRSTSNAAMVGMWIRSL
jgi:thiol-disulfide isomerase/thioredoxin